MRIKIRSSFGYPIIFINFQPQTRHVVSQEISFMKYIFSIISILLLLPNTLTFAQAPGYMGKRFSLEASGSINFANLQNENGEMYSFSSKSINGASKTLLAFNTRYGLTLNFATTRKHMVSLGYERAATGLGWSFNDNVGGPFGFRDNYVRTNGYSQIFSLGISTSRKKSIAPFGAYTRWTAQVSYNQIVPVELKGRPRTTDDLKDYSYMDYGIGFEHGARKVIFGKLLLGFSYRVNIPLGTVLDRNPGENELANSRIKEARERFFWHSLLMFNTSLGYMF